jgi:hypothetical protein
MVLIKMGMNNEQEVLSEFAKNIRNALDQELLYNLCIATGWYGAIISYQNLVEVEDWINKNKLGEVRWFDNRVAFQESKDYEWFILRWG